ncbi:hypothetical protein [Bacillus infantis]|uniref:hypothetical protein n=1 Tax=Bacillus infantis TaxID=324767 RepID=UPI003CF6F6AE
MASTSELCEIITELNGNPEALSDKLSKTLTDEIIRLLASGSSLHLDATDIAYGEESTVDEQLDALDSSVIALDAQIDALDSRVTTLETEMEAEQARTPTSAEVLSAIQNMDEYQIADVRTALGITTE